MPVHPTKKTHGTGGKPETLVRKKQGQVCMDRSLCHSEVCRTRDYSAAVVPWPEETSGAATGV